MGKPTISNETFVKGYLENKSFADLARSLGLTKESVAARANRLKKLGVNLPDYERQKKKIDVSALNSLIPTVS